MHQESASAIPSSPSSLWAVMNSWFSPAVLFVLLNLIIGTIAYTSAFTNQKDPRSKPNHQPKLTSSLSLLQRIKSITFQSNHQQSQEPPEGSSLSHRPNQDVDTLFASDQAVQKPSESHYFFQENLLSEVHHIFSRTHCASKDSVFDDFQQPHDDIGELYSKIDSDINFSESQEENGQETPAHFAFSGKDLFFDDFQPSQEDKVFEDNEQIADEVYTQVKGSNVVRTKSDITRERSSSKAADGDAEVDSKADDFINRFKHQLKLQRLDSIVRYEDVIARGSSGGRTSQ